MSGTSFDGVDAALIRTDGKNYIKKLDSHYVEYNRQEKKLYQSSVIENLTEIKNK